ncbi:uncharacterized protein LOC100185515 isoform X1 [Ciona intestinalis]
MDSETPSPLKSPTKVVIKISPVEDDKMYSPSPNTGKGMKSSLKSRRQSMLVVTTPTAQVKHVTVRRLSEPMVHEDTDERGSDVSFPEMLGVEEEEEFVPQHHQVLYELLGADKAESILNPKMEEPAKNNEEISEMKHRKRLPAVDTGVGADALWKMLKKESDRKLQSMDNRIPTDWKVSYGAFLRDSLNQNRSIVHRSFTHHVDVPELDKLMDKRYRERVRKARHHTNVMFRASENNKNKTTLLLSNNPVPDYNDREGTQTLHRYFSEKFAIDDKSETSERDHILNEEEREDIRKRFSNIHFLSEDACRTRGTFYGKYAKLDDLKMVTDIPGYKSSLPPSMTSRITISAPVHDLSGFRPQIGQRRLFSRKPSTAKRDPKWQPLTVGALMEYAPTKRILGFGEFGYGQASRWKTPAPSTA